MRWSETTQPWIFSGGQVAHHPMTAVGRPASEVMSHTARTLRRSLVTGSDSPVFGSMATKCPMPWASGVRPVAIVVHRIGESIGSEESSRP